MNTIQVKQAKEGKDLKTFIMLPWKIYKDDKIWVAPIISQYKNLFNKKKNPFFLHGDMVYFIAKKDGQTVGRIAAIENYLHNETYDDKVGFFGFFESIDNQEVANALLETAEKYLKEKGYSHMRGPASPSSNEEYGCQYTGFEHQHVILSTYNAPYYLKLYENYGLKNIKELFAYRFLGKDMVDKNAKRIDGLRDRILQRAGMELEILNMKKYNEAVASFKELFNSAWTESQNHGWVPLTNEEFDNMAKDLKAIIEPNLIMLVKKDGKAVGGCICLPDYNELFKAWKGKLFPFNWVSMYTKRKKIKCARIVILGIQPEYQKTGVDALMYLEIARRGLKLGFVWAEASYIVEDNYPIRTPLEKIGGECYKKYKVLEKAV